MKLNGREGLVHLPNELIDALFPIALVTTLNIVPLESLISAFTLLGKLLFRDILEFALPPAASRIR